MTEATFLSTERIYDVFVEVGRSVYDISSTHPEDMAAHVTTLIDGAAATLVALRAAGVVRWDQ